LFAPTILTKKIA